MAEEKKTRHELMTEQLRLIIEIEQLFTDVDSWNRNARQEGESKINPDPDGQLAGQWIIHTEGLKAFINQFQSLMNKHFNQYAPVGLTEIEQAESNAQLIQNK